MKKRSAHINFIPWLLLFALVFAWPASTLAHVEQGQAIGFITGLEHPWSGLDHVLAMIAVGLWGAQLGNPALWIIEIGIAVSAILLGGMVLGEVRPKPYIAAMLVGFFAIFHGHAHGTELPAGQSGLLYSMGFVIATGVLHGIGILMGTIHRWPAGKLALRGAGAFISAMGFVFLWQAVA
jgi:urease accessory protein